jgi:hypothetical protein
VTAQVSFGSGSDHTVFRFHSSPISHAMVEIGHEGVPGNQKGDRNRNCVGLSIRRRNPQLRVRDFDWRCDRHGVCGSEMRPTIE